MLVLNDQVWAPEQGLTVVEAQVQETAHRFASDVIRPVGIALDRLQPEKVIAKGSPLWDAFDGYWDLGLDLEDISDELSPVEVARLTYLVNEELGWGDTGLGWSLYASGLARAMIKNLGRDDLAELCPPGTIGMWSITEPDHGSDLLDFSHSVSTANQSGLKSNCVVVKRAINSLFAGTNLPGVPTVASPMCRPCSVDTMMAVVKPNAPLLSCRWTCRA